MALFTAVTIAPNPGLPVAIANLTSLTTFAAAILLAKVLPAHFSADPVSIKALGGIVLIVIGAGLIAIK